MRSRRVGHSATTPQQRRRIPERRRSEAHLFGRNRLGIVAAAMTAVTALAACTPSGRGRTTNPGMEDNGSGGTRGRAPTSTTADIRTLGGPAPLYLDAAAAPADRADDLLGRMTLDEKIGQITLVEKNSITPDQVRSHLVGALLSGGGGSPADNSVTGWREMVAAFQEAALDTRLGIPMLYGVDAVHGHSNVRGAVIFPHNIGLGAGRNPELTEEVGRITALEMVATGIRWDYAPVLAVPRDIRWGRTYEAFAEDPALVTDLGLALLRGLQGDDLAAETSVLATPKHFVGDGGTEWGSSTVYRIDQGVTTADEAELRSVDLVPYPPVIDAGALSIMASYSSWEHGKVHGDHYLLTEMLRGELGFEGFVVSDWAAVDQVAPAYYESLVRSINAGIDMVMVPSAFEAFQDTLRQAVERGDITGERIDEAVRRILEVKFTMGLFEIPMPGEAYVDLVGSDDHRSVARRAVAESVVILETAPHVLPVDLSSDQPVLLAGAGADNIGLQSGGWTIYWQGGNGEITPGTTIREGLEEVAAAPILYERSGRFDDTSHAGLGIVVVSEPPYAEGRGDSADLTFPPDDVAVIQRVRDRVDRLVVILLSGRPMILGPDFDAADALLAAWLPGTEGAGVVDVLTGRQPAGGRLPFTWPTTIDDVGVPRAERCDGARYPYGYGLDTSGTPLIGSSDCDGGQR